VRECATHSEMYSTMPLQAGYIQLAWSGEWVDKSHVYCLGYYNPIRRQWNGVLWGFQQRVT